MTFGENDKDRPALAGLEEAPPAALMAPAMTLDQPAWERVAAAGFSARREPGGWTSCTFRLPGSTWAALQARKLADARRTGDYSLAVAPYYLQAAFAEIPRVDRAARISEVKSEIADARRRGEPGVVLVAMMEDALRKIPPDGAPDARAAARMGLAWQQKTGGRSGALIPVAARIMQSTKAEMQKLGFMLGDEQPNAELWVFQAACVQALLDAHEREPPPAPPGS